MGFEPPNSGSQPPCGSTHRVCSCLRQIVPASAVIDIRFPGQYYDAETGLHYNYHRYYDPSIGRYISADPIGQAGGVNLYSYVGNNPLNWIDPTGEVGVLAALALALSGSAATVMLGTEVAFGLSDVLDYLAGNSNDDSQADQSANACWETSGGSGPSISDETRAQARGVVANVGLALNSAALATAGGA
jgi:RHS repeat-associated protein